MLESDILASMTVTIVKKPLKSLSNAYRIISGKCRMVSAIIREIREIAIQWNLDIQELREKTTKNVR